MKSKLPSSKSSGICIFCYRDSSSLPSQVDGSKEEGGKGTIDQFVELAQRWLQTDLSLHANDAEEGDKIPFEACEDCLLAVNSFCQLYHEWKCLELEVEWRLTKLCSVIRHADRVTSRKQRLETTFNSSEEGRKFIGHVTKFRKEFKRKCAHHHSKISPRVVLKRINGRRSCENSTKQETTDDGAEQKQMIIEDNAQQLCLEWISTFAAVLLLGNWIQGSSGIIEENSGLQILDYDDDNVNAPYLKEGKTEVSSPCASLAELEDEAYQIVSLVTLENELDTKSEYSESISKINQFEVDTPRFSPNLLKTKSQKRKSVQSSLHKIKRKLRRRELNKRTFLFKCFICNRKFAKFEYLQRHRRSFTHVYTKQQVVGKSESELRIIKCESRENQRASALTSDNNMNVGIFRPLRRTFEQNENKNDDDTDTETGRSSLNAEDTDSSEFQDDSSTESDSCSSSSDELSSDCLNSSMSTSKHHTRRPQMKKQKYSFVCSVESCQESFRFEEELELHKKYHGNFTCSFCKETFSYATDLARHELSHSDREIAWKKNKQPSKNERYHCARCNYTTCGLINYFNHHLTNHLNLPTQKSMCPICKAWLSRSSVTPHMLAHHKDSESRHKCNQCSAHFAKSRQLDLHKTKQHHPIKKESLYCCDVDSCQKGFAAEQELESHKRLHGNFPCKFCSVVENYSPDLALHEVTHSKSKLRNGKFYKYFCARCKFSTNHEFKLINHYGRAHFFLESCAICQKTLAAGNHNHHFQSHHDTNNIDPKEIKNCSKCPAYFLKEMQLKAHINKLHPRKDKKLKSFPCEIDSCSEGFDFKEELEAHKKQHGSFPCKNCSAVKTYAPNLALHELSHSGRTQKSNKKGCCSRCEYKYSDKHQYVTHFLTRHLQIQQLIVCRICRKSVVKTSLKLHNRLLHRTDGVDPILIQKCDQCPAYFLKKNQLTGHINQIHVNKRSATLPKATQFSSSSLLHCDAPVKCSRIFETIEQLENHRKLHGTFPCSTCKAVLTYAPKLALHEVTHTSTSTGQLKKRFKRVKTFTCPKCNEIVVRKFRYINHYLVTHMKLPAEGLTCPNCSDVFENNSGLDMHRARFHKTDGENRVVSKCDQCSATFGTNFYLILHKQRFHGEENRACVDCGRKMANTESLRLHRVSVHKKKEEEFPFPCDVSGCKRRFENETRLGWHQHHTHNSKGVDNSLVCHECGKKCATKTGFTNHMRFHSNSMIPKRFVCEECGKFFKTRAMLDIHQLSHGGSDRWEYACLFCGKKSATKFIFMEHIRTHTNEKPYSCEYCGEEYAHRHNLRNHRNSKHDANDLPKVYKLVNARVSRKGQKLRPSLK